MTTGEAQLIPRLVLSVTSKPTRHLGILSQWLSLALLFTPAFACPLASPRAPSRPPDWIDSTAREATTPRPFPPPVSFVHAARQTT